MVAVDIAALRSIEREKEIPFEHAGRRARDRAAHRLQAHRRTPMPHARVAIDRKTGEVIVWAQDLDADGELVEEYDDTPDRLRPGRRHDRPAGDPAAAARRRARPDLRRVLRPRGRHRHRRHPGRRPGRAAAAWCSSTSARSRRCCRTSEQVPGEELHPRHPDQVPTSSASPAACAGRRSRSAAPTRTWSRSCSPSRCPRSPTAASRSSAWRARPGTAARSRFARTVAGLNAKGACIGPMGQRVRNVVAELHGEKIDIIDWADDPATLVGNALSPAQRRRRPRSSTSVTQSVRVVVPDYQLSLAIGREGQNARLAARLTGWRIDIHSDAETSRLGRARRRPADAAGRRHARPRGVDCIEWPSRTTASTGSTIRQRRTRCETRPDADVHRVSAAGGGHRVAPRRRGAGAAIAGSPVRRSPIPRRRAAGRGAWLHPDPDCVELASGAGRSAGPCGCRPAPIDSGAGPSSTVAATAAVRTASDHDRPAEPPQEMTELWALDEAPAMSMSTV